MGGPFGASSALYASYDGRDEWCFNQFQAIWCSNGGCTGQSVVPADSAVGHCWAGFQQMWANIWCAPGRLIEEP
ncbi:hypothetical protein M409DRAFT_24076 [Zasmidium cellare ATCC 36951]|uniref:Uncharacterized protein n=1 Tax=Zasmidium cellare ATCC 36951 TaxID=1080233 RepID=A0A6A6CJA7_ZASCE|nr:uncharacterized protein M409DRAFT_24076 [Zasmidium cellare ATCC 36951]KAF2165789.1 hypothetical protein M409DRAFT_24076 [Zasmidium cellare ATCC 36951]